MSECAGERRAVVLRTMPTSQNRDMGHPAFELGCLEGVCSMALDSLKNGLKERVRAGEDWWFDTTRRVQTSGLVRRPEASKIVGEIRDSHMYGPVRVANAHAALRDLPLGGAQNAGGGDYSKYTFIDVGSGKGRVLFLGGGDSVREGVGGGGFEVLHERGVGHIE